MNKHPDLKHIYVYNSYIEGDGIYIECRDPEYPDECGIDLTVNLIEYGLLPADDHIFIPVYQFGEDTSPYQEFFDHFVTASQSFKFGEFGCQCLYCQLREDWKDFMKPMK